MESEDGNWQILEVREWSLLTLTVITEEAQYMKSPKKWLNLVTVQKGKMEPASCAVLCGPSVRHEFRHARHMHDQFVCAVSSVSPLAQ
jgi:hypothetical protein